MKRASVLAQRGWGRVHPNPLCGAVVVAGDTIVGEGYHGEFGGPHAEPLALDSAGGRALGATLYVTLEPCTHLGKQPPCVPAIIEAGIQRVVAAVRDPNPSAKGGAHALRAAGIQVDLGLGAREAAAANALFLHRHRNPTRPFVALKLATSLDGRIADPAGRSQWVSGPRARAYVHWVRAGFDALGVGGETARRDDPSLTVRGDVTPRSPPVRVIFDRKANLPVTLKVVETATTIPTVVMTSGIASVEQRSPLERRGVEIVSADTLGQGLETLRARGVASLLIEGGGRLAAAFLAADLVDRYYWIQSPLWLGAEAVPAVAGLPGRPLAEASRWTVVERRALDEDTLLVVDRVPCSPAS